jgi:hypothetical protein
VTLQCPSRARAPGNESECGRRERESRRGGRREQSLRDRHESSTWRDGERHPGPLEGGTLRGVSSERGPRSVRRLLRVSSRGSGRADDSGCPEGAEEGNAVSMRDLCACTHRRHERSSHALGDASFARSFDPCTLILTMLRGASFGGGAHESASRLGKPGQPGGTSTGAGMGGRSAARRVSPLPQGRGRDTSKKRKEIEVSVPARIEEFGFGCPHVVSAVAEVGRRRLASNKLGKRAPKRAVRVE